MLEVITLSIFSSCFSRSEREDLNLPEFLTESSQGVGVGEPAAGSLGAMGVICPAPLAFPICPPEPGCEPPRKPHTQLKILE